MGNVVSDIISNILPLDGEVEKTDNGLLTNEEDIKSHSLLSGPFKLVLCVNMSLGMQKGKMAAQCCHATLGAYKLAMKQCPRNVQLWEYIGQAKIAVKAESNEQLADLQKAAKAAGLVTYLVHDAGKTQIAFGSKTVLAIGPAPVSAFEGITSDLKLL
jgi:peptidyl-tRNA hydrolase